MKFQESSLELLKTDGFLLAPSLLENKIVDQIKKDLYGYEKITFNHQYGSQAIGGNLWIENLGVCSEAAMKTALNTNLLTLIDSYFGEKSVLGTIKYQKKITSQPGIPLHSDRGPGIVMFIFLNEITQETGATRFVKGSHLYQTKTESATKKNTDADYISEGQKVKSSDLIVSHGGPGTILLYSQRTWHDLPSFEKPGREIIWAIYYPKSNAVQAENQLFRHNILITLSADQRERLFQEGPTTGISFTKFGNEKSVADSYSIASWKILLYVGRYHLYRILRKLKNSTKRAAMVNKYSSQARQKSKNNQPPRSRHSADLTK